VTGNDRVGGLVGWNDGEVTNCYADGTVAGSNSTGGLIGLAGDPSYASISHFSGTVTGNDRVGGLAGWNDGGTLINCYAAGTVTGSNSTGGLMGWSNGTVSSCWATGSVTGSNCTGGLVGSNEGTVDNSYSTGSVVGNDTVGGLVGSNGVQSTVNSSYSTGSVAGNSSVGGLLGASSGTVINSFWDIETSAQNTSAGGIGKNTTHMKDISTFLVVVWDIVAVGGPGERHTGHIWNIVDDVTYPFLSWQPV
jgi:hypothetical protein